MAAERHVIGTYEAAYSVDEDVEGELHLGRGGGGDSAEVGGSSEGFPPGGLVEDRFGFGDVEGGGARGGKGADVGGVVED